jgi:hypothetical protein
MKRSIILTALLVLNLSFAVAQAKNSRKEYTAVDNHTYKKGDMLTFGTPARGTEYEYIIISDIVSVGDYITVFTGGTIEEKKSNNATKEQLSKMNGSVIKHFANGVQDNKLAVLKYNDKKEILVFFDKALQNGEIKSQAEDFQTTADKIFANAANGQSDGNGKVKSFSPNIDVKILSVVGDKKAQTVTVNLLISHKLVHQNVCLDNSRINAFDYEGNEYYSKAVAVGNARSGDFICNTIPTEVPVKSYIVFKQILPSVKGLKFAAARVGFGPADSWSNEFESLELSDLVIDWK